MLQCDDVIIQWMMRWAAMMVSRYMFGKDANNERKRGRACIVPVATFGESGTNRSASRRSARIRST